MNIEIANRLIELRKEKGLSQEALANKLGVSRQAVSKWERAESSPDTDNLILLAQIYDISLDDLLKINQNEFESEKNQESKEENEKQSQDEVHISLKKGVHVKDKDGSEVRVGWDGIHVSDHQEDHEVHVDNHGVYVDGKKYDKQDFIDMHKKDFPFTAIIFFVYLFIGLVYDLWHPGWLVLFLVPIFDSLIEAWQKKDLSKIAYPVIVVLVFLYTGFIYGLWHPMWVLFLSIPAYYSIVQYFKK